MNRALRNGGVFYVARGTALLWNSSFVKNSARAIGGVLIALQQSSINITQSFCFGNQAETNYGVLVVTTYTQILIIGSNITQNSAYNFGALAILDSSSMELIGSLVEGNSADILGGALLVANNSLFVAINSSFKRNKAYQHSSISIWHSIVYLQKCTWIENQMSYYGGTIAIQAYSKLKVFDTSFTQNKGYDIVYLVEEEDY